MARSRVLVPLGIILAGCTRHVPGELPNPELLRLFEEDQAQRSGPPEEIDWAHVGPADERRRTRAGEIVAAGGAHTAQDFYCAAMLFQHGNSESDFERARSFALRAVELRPTYTEARWLAAAALDRRRTAAGLPQKYGTQYRRVGQQWELYPVEPGTSDEERRQWSVPSLNDALDLATRMNRQPRTR